MIELHSAELYPTFTAASKIQERDAKRNHNDAYVPGMRYASCTLILADFPHYARRPDDVPLFQSVGLFGIVVDESGGSAWKLWELPSKCGGSLKEGVEASITWKRILEASTSFHEPPRISTSFDPIFAMLFEGGGHHL